MTARENVIGEIRSLPAIPAVAARLAEVMRDKDVEFGRVAEVMQYDPGLTAKVIQLANSARFGAGRPIASLKDALVRLGLEELYHLVFVASLSPVMRCPLEGYDLAGGQLWRHCVATAIAAEGIDSDLDSSESGGLAFTAGLLHDVGKLVLGCQSEEYFRLIEQMANSQDEGFDEAERQVLGIDHTEVGALVLEKWGFPDELIEVVRCHHSPESAVINPRLTDIVHVADMVAMMMGQGLGRDALGYRASSGSMERLGLRRQSLETAAIRMLDRLEEVKQMFMINGD